MFPGGGCGMTDRDPRIITALRLVISDIQRSVAPAVAESRFFQLWDDIQADDAESPAERCRRENTEGLRVIAALGNVRGAEKIALRPINVFLSNQ